MVAESLPVQAVRYIQKRKPNFVPRIGLITGSGQNDLANKITNPVIIPYNEIPGFPKDKGDVAGHAGQLVLGELEGVPIACLLGRLHFYEGATNEDIKNLIRPLKLLGCQILLATNASGSLRPEVGPGELVVVSDHINFNRNPLIGPNDDEFGPRFYPMHDAYDESLRQGLLATAEQLDIKLHEGVYIGVTGPCFETPAEIRAFKLWGADLVGMSTVPDVLVARHCGLRVAVIATVTNLAAGLSDESLSHEGTLHHAGLAAEKLQRLLSAYIKKLDHELGTTNNAR